MRILFFFAILVLAVGLPGSAQARWLEASSDHFVVYADDSEKDLRAFTQQLERYDAAMGFLFNDRAAKPSPSNRVTIYVVKNERDVRKLLGNGAKNVAGFYVPRAGASVAFVPKIDVQSRETDRSMLILLHEYAHHFLISNSSFPMPAWMSEGAAEFYASASFNKDGGVSLGRPAQHRAYELYNDGGLTVEQILSTPRNDRSRSFNAFYGKSWLLYHYLMLSGDRTGQIRKYGQALRNGLPLRDAAVEAFGDLDQLEKDVGKYLSRRRMNVIQLSGEKIDIGPVQIRTLGNGEADMMPVRITSTSGVTREQALELLSDAREIAADYPGDAAVLAALAEAEFDAGFDDRAIAAADGALAIDPKRVNAYVQKGYAMFRKAENADDREAAFAEAVKPFVALNKIENDHPLPLIYFYRSYMERGAKPSELAVRGLDWASQLARFDLGLRFMLARQDLLDRDFARARANLIPVAYNPHGGALASQARAVLDALEKIGDPEQLARMMAASPETDMQTGGDREGENGEEDGETGDALSSTPR